MIYYDYNDEFLDESVKLDYSLFMAEYDLSNELLKIYEGVILGESSGLMYIEESIKETIIRYLNKIVTSLQKAWESFMGGITQSFTREDSAKIKALNLTDEQLSSIVIDNFPIYDDQRIKSIEVKKFEYGDMKQYLKDDKTFLGHYYPNIAPKKGEKLKDTVFKYCLVERKNEFHMTTQDLDNIVAFMDSYKTQFETVKNDLDKVNQAAKDINNVVDNSTEDTTVNNLKPEETAVSGTATVTATNAPQTGNTTATAANSSFTFDSLDDAVSLLESFLLYEADAGKPEPATGAAAGSGQANPHNAPGGNPPPKNKQDKENDQNINIKQDRVTKSDKNAQIVKDVQVYMSASTKVLVAKMKLLRTRCRNYSKIIRTIIAKYDKNAKKENNKRNTENQNNSQLQQIDTNIK